MNANMKETKMPLHGVVMAVRREMISALIMNEGNDEHHMLG